MKLRIEETRCNCHPETCGHGDYTLWYKDTQITTGSKQVLESIKSGIEGDIPASGYHITDIPKGTLGEASKILEEAQEFSDACLQNCKIMALVELADLYGAMELYLKKHHPETTMDDLKLMAFITKRAFENGERT